MDLFTGITINLIALGIGSLIGYLARYAQVKYLKHVHRRNINRFFNFSGAPIIIAHSAIFDETRCAYNYPSCDTRSARIIAKLLESVGMTEGKDFSITFADDLCNANGQVEESIWNSDLILLCSPKRNAVASEVLKLAPKLRYTLSCNPSTQMNQLIDKTIKEELISSRDRKPEDANSDSGYDYGLILNLHNPYKLSRSVTILAGVHGAGTLGSSIFLSDPTNLKSLISNRRNKIIQNVIKVEYSGGNETIESTTLV